MDTAHEAEEKSFSYIQKRLYRNFKLVNIKSQRWEWNLRYQIGLD
jgi:hypothetical protein